MSSPPPYLTVRLIGGTNMFEEFYCLKHTPFSRDIPTEHLYRSSMLEEILGRLEYAARRQLFAVVTGVHIPVMRNHSSGELETACPELETALDHHLLAKQFI